jgi:hypothetical protein
MNEKDFVTFWVSILKEEGIKSFPEDFKIESDYENISLGGNRILIGKEFFGEYELINIDGKEVLRVDSYEKAKYFVYANRNQPKAISVPTSNIAVKQMVSAYEKYLDIILKRISSDYTNKFPGMKNSAEVINRLFDHLNLIRLK